MKLVRCRDHGFDCNFEAKAQTEEDVLQMVAEHAQTAYDLDVTPELVEQVRQKMHEVPE